jgi:uncharacterized protein YndB with AHSA1/START domain
MRSEKNSTAERELRFSRLLDAPVELVWEIWANPEHLKHWWGPHGHNSTIAKMDVRAGGEWDLTMRGSDGKGHRHQSTYLEVVKYKKIVYEQHTHFKYIATIEFEKRNDKTFLTWSMLFESKEYLEEVAKTIGVANGFTQHNERLIDYLSQMISKL